MRKNKIKFMSLLLTGIITGCLVGCSKSTTEEKVVDYSKTGFIEISNIKHELPLSVEDLEKNGYSLDLQSLGISDSEVLAKGFSYNEYVSLLKEGEECGVFVKLANVSDEDKLVSNADIYSLRFSTDDVFHLEGGIKVGSSKEDFTLNYGEPLISSEVNGITVLTFDYNGKGFIKAEFSKDISIAIEYLIDDIEAKEVLSNRN